MLIINIAAFIIYLIVAHFIVTILPKPSTTKDVLLAITNSLFVIPIFFYVDQKIQLEGLATLVGIIMISYFAASLLQRKSYYFYIAILAPIVILVLSKLNALPGFLGLSYLAFRLSYLVFEIKSERIEFPSFVRYAHYAVFPPIFLIGPISPYQLYSESLDQPRRELTPLIRSLSRIGIGIIKIGLLAVVFKTMDFKSLWFDQYEHDIADFFISCICTYLHLYLNFSGACDIIIGVCGILNIRIKENFNNPLLAQNIAEFWKRFHITLSDFMKTLVFIPGQLTLTRMLGNRCSIPITIFMLVVTFVLIGLWHGIGLNFLILGLLHSLGMSVFYLYALVFLRFPKSIQRILKSKPAKLLSISVTFLFVSFTSLFIMNDWQSIQHILLVFNW